MKHMLFTFLALVSVAFAAAACNDDSRNVVEPDPFGGPGFSTSGEAIELDPLIVTACPPGTSGMYPDCQPDRCDPVFEASCNPDPCYYDSSSSGCSGDPCINNPSGPGCGGDPCAYGACGSGWTDLSGTPPAAAPDGIPQFEYDKLNFWEKLLCAANTGECGHVITHGYIAGSWAREMTPELGAAEGDNKRDALRHTAWQAMLAWVIGTDRARLWGNAHETSSESLEATCMDQWNNAVGRAIGISDPGYDEIKAAVLQAWAAGQLKGSPFPC
jgi:hypothetical protein